MTNAAAQKQDTEEKHYLERELLELVRSSRQVFSFLDEGCLDGLWYWDIENPEQEWLSPKFKALFGYEVDEIPHTAEWWQKNIHPDDLQLALDNFEQSCADPDHPYDQVVRYKHKNGSTVWVRCRGLVIRNEAGEPIRLLGAHNDVSALMEAQSNARVNEDQLRLIFDNIPSRVWFKDETNRILKLNKTAADSMNMSVEEAEGQNTYDLFPDLAKKYHLDDLEVINSGEPKHGIIEAYTPRDASAGWVQTDKTPYTDPVTGERFVLVTSTDITDLKLAQEKLVEQAKELKRSNEELEQFAYVASHDLQEPLRMVASYCELISRRYADNLDETGLEFLNFAVDGARRMQNLLDDLLNYSRVGRMEMKQKPVQLSEVVENVREILNEAQGEQKADFELSSFPVVLGDPKQLGRVFQNLVHNAIKFRSDRPLKIKIDTLDQGDRVIVRVTDNGIGIDPAYKERVFELFKRLSRDDGITGTGIGLAISRRLVERHGGELWLDETHQDGARFCFSLQRA